MRCQTLIFSALLLMVGTGCRTAPPWPSADFSATGWHVQAGQAVWKPSANQSEIAGDLLLATNANGNVFVQFSKMPFPVVTVQVAGDRWQIEFGADKHTWHGHGAPPERFGWFQLPAALAGETIRGNWRFANPTADSWRLENPRTGEILEGGFFP